MPVSLHHKQDKRKEEKIHPNAIEGIRDTKQNIKENLSQTRIQPSEPEHFSRQTQASFISRKISILLRICNL